jgi:shikimate dehydrogenase
MPTYGLIGKSIAHSFSPAYFAQKFAALGLNNSHQYALFPLAKIEEVAPLLQQKDIFGLNVTIPYKQQIIPFLDSLDPQAEAAGAVNTIVKQKNRHWRGYNTDIIGFGQSLDTATQKLNFELYNALILGSGGAAKAVQQALLARNISFKTVSRKAENNNISYENCSAKMITAAQLIINTTPLGMSPNIETCPDIDYSAIGQKHLLFDLVYNPKETVFLQRGKAQGAQLIGGLQMLHAQADAAWQIWQNNYLAINYL